MEPRTPPIEAAAPAYAIDDTIPNAWTPVAPAAARDTAMEQAVESAPPAPSAEFVPAPKPEPSIAPEAEPMPAHAPTWHAEVAAPERTPAHVPSRHVEPVVARNVPETPRVSLELPPDSGLVLIETHHERTDTAAATDEPAVPRPRRIRPPRVEVADEPLQLVETQKEPMPPVA